MSKSLNNYFTVRDLLDQGVPGEVIRFVLLGTHYRKPMDWTKEKVAQAKATLWKWHEKTKGVVTFEGPNAEFLAAIKDDLNTPQALTVLHSLADAGRWRELKASANLIGLLEDWSVGWTLPSIIGTASGTMEIVGSGTGIVDWGLPTFFERLSRLRADAFESKDFAAVDALKSALTLAGVEVRMSKTGVELLPGPDFDPAKLEALK